VHLLTGPLSAAVGYAVSPYIESKKIPAIYPIVSADDLTQRKRNPYLVRTGWTSSQPSHPFGKWVFDNLKYKKIATIGYDFAFGWEVAAGFQRTFEEAGGQIVQKLWPPLGTADFAPYLSQLRRDVDAIYAVFSGADALRFGKQFAEAGLKEKLPLIGGGTFTDEHVLRVQGDEVLGVVTALHYSAALSTPANRKFVAAYEAKFNQVPSYYSEGTYVAGIALKAALETTGGDIENVDKFLTALRRVDLSDAPRGPMKFDDFGNPVQNVYVRRVEKVNGRLQNTVIHTFPNVSQFWTYKSDEYLKVPAYSRDYPPCRAC
jgi:branched-chain amino acid transport system substrate-binding protein